MKTRARALLALAMMGGSISWATKARADTTAPPATIVSQVRLGPAAGNGARPFSGAVDTRRNRLYVLNTAPDCLSVIDLDTRRLVDVVPLTTPVSDLWGFSDPRLAMSYDRRADCILIANGSADTPNAVIAVSAATRKVAAARTFPHQDMYRFAFSSARREIYAAGERQILVLDSLSLATKRALTTAGPICCMAVCEADGHLFTVEPSTSDLRHYGNNPPYSGARIVARDPVTGRVLAVSRNTFSRPSFLLADDTVRRLYMVHGNASDGDLISGDRTTVSIVSESTLRQGGLVRTREPGADRMLLDLGRPVLDAPRHRLIMDRFGSDLAVVDLGVRPRISLRPVEGSLFSEYRLGPVLPRTGQPVLLIDNAVRLMDSRTLKEGASIILGATVQNLFLDRNAHRLLAYVDRNVHEVMMLTSGRAQRLFKSKMLPRTRLLDVDFKRRILYYVYNNGWGSGVGLNAVDFNGKGVTVGMTADGEYAGLTATATPNRFLRLLYPGNPESTNSVKHRSLDIVVDARRTLTVAVESPDLFGTPQQLLYAPDADRAYVRYNRSMTAYSCADLASSGVPLSGLSGYVTRPLDTLPGKLAVDEAGRFGYYADPLHKEIVKISLADGGLVERRSLGFTPDLPLVDSAAGRLYVADADGGRVVAISLF